MSRTNFQDNALRFIGKSIFKSTYTKLLNYSLSIFIIYYVNKKLKVYYCLTIIKHQRKTT